jgi:hypothetical protein
MVASGGTIARSTRARKLPERIAMALGVRDATASDLAPLW